MSSDIQYYCYPRTQSPPDFVDELVSAFRANKASINTRELDDGLKTDDVLEEIRPQLEAVDFDVDTDRLLTPGS